MSVVMNAIQYVGDTFAHAARQVVAQDIHVGQQAAPYAAAAVLAYMGYAGAGELAGGSAAAGSSTAASGSAAAGSSAAAGESAGAAAGSYGAGGVGSAAGSTYSSGLAGAAGGTAGAAAGSSATGASGGAQAGSAATSGGASATGETAGTAAGGATGGGVGGAAGGSAAGGASAPIAGSSPSWWSTVGRYLGTAGHYAPLAFSAYNYLTAIQQARQMENPNAYLQSQAYQTQLSQGDQAVEREMAAKGMYRSTNLAYELAKYNTGLSGQYQAQYAQQQAGAMNLQNQAQGQLLATIAGYL